MVVDENGVLSSVAIKPFALRLRKDIRIILSCVVGFSNSRWSPNPHASCGFGSHWLLLVDLVKIDTLLYLSVFADIDQSCVYRCRDSHLQDFGVTSCDVAFLVSPGGLNSKAPRTFDPCIFFVAIIVCAIIKFNNLKMAARALFFQMCHSNFLWKIYEVLYMNSTVVAALQLSCYVVYLRRLTPCLEKVFSPDVGVV